MIEQRVTNELNKEQTNLKLQSLSKFSEVLVVISIMLAVTVFFSILSIFDSETQTVHKCLLVIPIYKLVVAAIIAMIAQKFSKQCLEEGILTRLDTAILLNILTAGLLLSSIQQFCAILSGFSSAGSYSYYIVIVVALASIMLMQSGYVLQVSAAMIIITSIDFLVHVLGKLLCHVDFVIKTDITILVNSAVATIIAVAVSYYAANALQKMFTTYCIREAKLRHYKAIAETDALTKISNRRAFDLDVDLLSRMQLKTIAVAMIDIDDFKKFNDEFGHDIGDFVLKQVGLAISQFNSKTGIEAYRYGGEEFVILFSNVTPMTDIEALLNNFRQQISEITIPNVERTITISIGLSYNNLSAAKTIDVCKESIMQTLKFADTQLYEAKHTGKNKLCVSHIVKNS